MIRWVVAGQDLFADELATYWIVSTNNLSGVVDTVSTTAEISPPLGFMLSWLGSRISLDPEFVRLPALIAGIATIPLVYAVGARTVGRGAALTAATLTTLSPFMIFYSAEARGYGVMMALVLLSTLALLLACDRGGARWWALYAVCVALAAYTHYTSVFVLGGQFAWALWTQPQARKPLLISTAVAAARLHPLAVEPEGRLRLADHRHPQRALALRLRLDQALPRPLVARVSDRDCRRAPRDPRCRRPAADRPPASFSAPTTSTRPARDCGTGSGRSRTGSSSSSC